MRIFKFAVEFVGKVYAAGWTEWSSSGPTLASAALSLLGICISFRPSDIY